MDLLILLPRFMGANAPTSEAEASVINLSINSRSVLTNFKL